MIKEIPGNKFFIYPVKDWKEKKEKFLDVIKDQEMIRKNVDDGLAEFLSDRDSPRNYVNDFMEIFEEELQEFGREIKVHNFKIEDIWTVKYEKGDWHAPHTHGTANLSAILYLDHDKEEHSATRFITENVNPLTNGATIMNSYIEEGTLMIFPAHMLHFTTPNKSDKVRHIVSFDITVTKRFNI